MHATTDALTERLAAAARQADTLLLVLNRLLPEPDTGGPRTGTIGRHAPESREPWNAQVADAYWHLWHGPGQLVNTMRGCIGLARLAFPPYGPAATDVIVRLAPACTPETVKHAVLRLERWVTRAQALPAIDEAEPWTTLPGPAGVPPACPYCGTLALRMRRRAGEVRCFFPDCVDADERPTRARMEPGRMTGEARLVFGDGTMMTFEGDGNA